MPVTKRRLIPEIYLIRTLAITGVLIVHATATSAVSLSPESAAYPLYILLNRFSAVGTITFIFLSSLVLFYNYYQRPLDKALLSHFYRRRALLVVMPYLVWSVAYYLFNLGLAWGWPAGLQEASLREFGSTLVYGTAYFHLYFVVINIQFYLAFPLLLWLLKRRPSWRGALPLLGLAGQWGFYFIDRYVTPIANKSSLAPTYLSHYFLGAYAGLYYDRFVSLLEKRRVVVLGRPLCFGHLLTVLWAVVGLGNSALYYQLYGHGVAYDGLWYQAFWSAYTYLAIFILVFWGRVIYRRARPGLVGAMTQVGTVSFGIYLIHPLFLVLWERRADAATPLHYHLQVATGFALVAVLSWAVTTAAHRRLPGSWLLFGPRPAAQRSAVPSSASS